MLTSPATVPSLRWTSRSRMAGGAAEEGVSAMVAVSGWVRLVLFAYGLAWGVVNAEPARAEQGSGGTVRILAFGDSLTAGFNLPHDSAFPARLEAALRAAGRDVAVIDAGVSGDTSASASARLEWVLREQYDAAIVELGANDALRGVTPESTYRNLDSILTRIGARGAPVLLAGMLAPPNLGPEFGDEFKEIYPRLADRHGALLFPFFLEGVAGVARLTQGDGMHPNAQGVEVIVANILPYVVRLLDRIPVGTAAGAADGGGRGR